MRRCFAVLLAAVFGITALAGCGKPPGAGVVVYCAQDQEYAEPLLAEFERETGVRARPLFDSEAVKTVGLAQRLLAERGRPRAGVFWGNEEMRSRQLAREGVFRETNGLAAFGYRSRRLVVNTNRLDPASAPRSLLELTNPVWSGRVALAYPLFGTTSAHFLALRQHWGAAGWEAWCRGLAANRPFLLEGNSMVVKFVGRGEAWIGLTDSDDIAAGAREGLPVAALPPGSETLYIPNTACVVRNGPNPAEAERLFKYLTRPETVARLVAAGALEGVEPPAGAGLRVDWERLLPELEPATAVLKAVFLR